MGSGMTVISEINRNLKCARVFPECISIHVKCSDTIQKQPAEVFCKKSILRNFAKLKGKHLR